MPGYRLGTNPSILLWHKAQPWLLWCWFQGAQGLARQDCSDCRSSRKTLNQRIWNKWFPTVGTTASTGLTSPVRTEDCQEWASLVYHFCLSKKWSTGVIGLTAAFPGPEHLAEVFLWCEGLTSRPLAYFTEPKHHPCSWLRHADLQLPCPREMSPWPNSCQGDFGLLGKGRRNKGLQACCKLSSLKSSTIPLLLNEECSWAQRTTHKYQTRGVKAKLICLSNTPWR